MSSVPRVLQKCTQSFTNDLIFTRKGQLSSVLHFPELKGRPHSQTVMSNHCVAGECLKQTTFFCFFPSLLIQSHRAIVVFSESGSCVFYHIAKTPEQQFCPVRWMRFIRINFHLINDLSWLFPSPTFPFRSWIKCDPLSLNAFPPSIFPIRVESQLLRTHYKAATQPLNICPPNTHTHSHTHFSSPLPLWYFPSLIIYKIPLYIQESQQQNCL